MEGRGRVLCQPDLWLSSESSLSSGMSAAIHISAGILLILIKNKGREPQTIPGASSGTTASSELFSSCQIKKGRMWAAPSGLSLLT